MATMKDFFDFYEPLSCSLLAVREVRSKIDVFFDAVVEERGLRTAGEFHQLPSDTKLGPKAEAALAALKLSLGQS